jgi:hypothetical protein
MSITDDCIEWDRRTNWWGYGAVSVKGRDMAVHRLAWAEANGPIPSKMCVLHKCDNPPCFNIDHLFLGTNADNIRDMMSKGRQRRGATHYARQKTHCKNGHAFSPENTNIRHGWRVCRTCRRERQRK